MLLRVVQHLLNAEGILDSMILTKKAPERSKLSEGQTLQKAIIFSLPQMYKIRNTVLHSCSFLLQNFLLIGATLSMPSFTALIMDGNVSRPQLQVAKMKCPQSSAQGLHSHCEQCKHDTEKNSPVTSFRLQKEISLFARNTKSK